MRILLCCMVLAVSLCLLFPERGACAVISGSSHFPTAVGSKWTFDTQAWTMSGAQQLLMSGTETVEVQADGIFKSYITLSNGNRYLVLEPARVIIDRVIALHAKIMRRSASGEARKYLKRRNAENYRPVCML